MSKTAITNFLHSNNASLFKLSAMSLLLISCFLHFWELGNIPQGLFIDEASIAYNAYCIAETGTDEYGSKLPVLFKCFGNYHDTVMVYSLVPLVKIFGLKVWVARFPSALYMVFASIAFYFLAYLYAKNQWIALGGAFAFSILPWSFPLSRSIMSGYTPMLLGIVLGWLFIFKAFSKKSYCLAFLAAFFWAFTMYSHNCGRPMAAAYLIAFGISMHLALLKRPKIFAFFSFMYVFLMLPMIWFVSQIPESMNSRFNEISVWKDNPGFLTLVLRILLRYTDYFNPVFLFWQGDSNFRHNIGVGGLYIFMIPLILAGLYVSIKKFKRNPYFRFVLLGLLVYPLAAVLTEERMHGTRSLNGLPFWGILAVVGVAYLWNLRSKYRWLVWAFCLLGCGMCLEVTKYMRDYFIEYKECSKIYFMGHYISALEYGCKELEEDQTLYISGFFFSHQVNPAFKPYWYAVIAFIRNIPPAVYQKEGIPSRMVSPFYGQKIKNDGILLTSNCQIRGKTRDGKLIIQKNPEKPPANAVLLRRIQINFWHSLNVYRVKSE